MQKIVTPQSPLMTEHDDRREAQHRARHVGAVAGCERRVLHARDPLTVLKNKGDQGDLAQWRRQHGSRRVCVSRAPLRALARLRDLHGRNGHQPAAAARRAVHDPACGASRTQHQHRDQRHGEEAGHSAYERCAAAALAVGSAELSRVRPVVDVAASARREARTSGGGGGKRQISWAARRRSPRVSSRPRRSA